MKKIPTEATRILDQGCGTGILTFRIARKFPLARVVGVELRDEYLQIAREKARQANFSNVDFILGRAEDVLPGGLFDCITSSYLAKYAELKVLIRNAKKMLRSGGELIMHDFIYPRNPVVVRIWEYYFRLLQTVGNRRYPQWREIYCGLPMLIRETKWMGELPHILKENDFSDISLQPLTLHTSAIITARRS